MSAAFVLDHSALAADSRFSGIAHQLRYLSPIDSQATFNRYCRKAIQLWDERFSDAPIGKTSGQFDQLLAQVDRGNQSVIQTGWGGVVITLHEHPGVEKFLVIRKGGYLALEKHEQKDERLEVRQGAGLVLWRRIPDAPLAVEVLKRGSEFHFTPGLEHCLVGTENLLVFERSTDPKGMDRDLIFIYTADPVS